MLRYLPCLLVVFVGACLSSPANAAPRTFHSPDMVSLAVGYKDFNKSEAGRQSADFRLEYRWGLSLLPKISSYFDSWDDYVQFHPFIGGEVTTWGQIYGLGGFAMDVPIGRHVILTWSEGIGILHDGDGFGMGSILEFRSQLEVGWRFANEMRLAAYISHTSNAKITNRNPGAEVAGLYFHMPISAICGPKQP